MKNKLKTTTIASDQDDGPLCQLCPGHVTPKQFEAASRKEGWSASDLLDEDSLKFEYWTVSKSGRYKKVSPNTKGAKPFTISYA